MLETGKNVSRGLNSPTSKVLKVKEFMSPKPTVIDKKMTIEEAYALMRDNGFRHLPVEEHGKLIGVISDRDILVALATDAHRLPTAEEVMTHDPYSVDPDADVADVLEIMANNKLGCAIIKDHGEVIGIFTTSDALNAMVSMLRKTKRRRKAS